jgi:hypothetical protein
MSFSITGLALEPFHHLFGQTDEALGSLGVIRYVADAMPGFPCRVTLADAEVGEAVLLLNYLHQPAKTPFRAAHAIYVREKARQTVMVVDEIPLALVRRPLSLRAFDLAGMMVDADLAEGDAIASSIERLLADRRCDYIHAHFARPGCYAARIDRAERSGLELDGHTVERELDLVSAQLAGCR